MTENMVAGTELNGRRQPFQGCSQPLPTPCNHGSYRFFSAHLGPLYGPTTDPQLEPRGMLEFASRTRQPKLNRHFQHIKV